MHSDVTRNVRKKIIIYAVITVAVLVVIFIFSNQEGSGSYRLSDWMEQLLTGTPLGAVVRFLENVGIPIRKEAHMFLYAVLGIFGSLLFIQIFRRKPAQILGAVIFCFAAAAFDEWHQTFIADRTGKWQDVLVDAAGFLITIALVNLLHILQIFLRRRKH